MDGMVPARLSLDRKEGGLKAASSGGAITTGGTKCRRRHPGKSGGGTKTPFKPRIAGILPHPGSRHVTSWIKHAKKAAEEPEQNQQSFVYNIRHNPGTAHTKDERCKIATTKTVADHHSKSIP